MKLICCLLLAVLCFTNANAQDAPPQPKAPNLTVVSLSPFNMIGGQFQLGVEKEFGPNTNSVLFQGSVILDNSTFNDFSASLGGQAELHYRYKFITTNNPERKPGRKFRFDFYAGPFAQYQYVQTDESYTYWDVFGQQHFVDERLRFHSLAGGVILGTRFLFLERLSLDIYAGGGVKYTFNDDVIDPNIGFGASDVFRTGLTGVIPKGNIQIGVAF